MLRLEQAMWWVPSGERKRLRTPAWRQFCSNPSVDIAAGEAGVSEVLEGRTRTLTEPLGVEVPLEKVRETYVTEVEMMGAW